MREYVVRYLRSYWHIVRIEDGIETTLDLRFGSKPEAEAVAKHLTHAKRPAQNRVSERVL